MRFQNIGDMFEIIDEICYSKTMGVCLALMGEDLTIAVND